VRQATLFVQLDDGRLGIRSQLGGGGTESIRGLQWMASLNPPAAPLAAADVDVELAVNRPTGNLDLVLMVDVGLGDGPAAVRAGIGKRGLVGLVDLHGRLAMRLDTVAS
jgi:hypothetical protein